MLYPVVPVITRREGDRDELVVGLPQEEGGRCEEGEREREEEEEEEEDDEDEEEEKRCTLVGSIQ
jgi:hypothetical protein